MTATQSPTAPNNTSRTRESTFDTTGLPPFNRKNRNVYVNINSRLIHRRRARISPFDAVVQGGDGVWEEMRVYEGKIFKLVEHVDRLRAGAETLGFLEVPSRPWIIGQIRRTLMDNEMFDAVHVRVTMTRGIKVTAGANPQYNKYGPTVLIVPEYKEYALGEPESFDLITSRYRRLPEACLDANLHGCSMLNHVLARKEAVDAGAEDALMLDIDGNVTETSWSSFFIVKGDTVITSEPGPGSEGITRDAVLEICAREGIATEVRSLSPDEVNGADEAFMGDTLREINAVTKIDDAAIGDGEPGDMTRRIAGLYHAAASTEGTKLLDLEDIEYEDEDEDDDDDDV